MKTYKGEREANGNDCKVTVDGKSLKERNDLENSSGFNWGYGGSGPWLLSLSLAADIYEDGKNKMKDFPLWYTASGINKIIKGLHNNHIPLRNWTLTEAELKEAGIKEMLKLTQPPQAAGRQYKQEARELAIKYGYGHLAILQIT